LRKAYEASAILLTILILIVIIHYMYTNITEELYKRSQAIQETTTTTNNRIILVVNKTIDEWKKIYRDYIIYSDKMIKEQHVVTGEYNITQLLEIINNANSSVIIRKFYFYDDVINKYVVLEVVIPTFVVELHEKDMPEWGTDPIIKEIAETLKKYVEEYPSNYTEYRLAIMILNIASQIHYKWPPKSSDLLLQIVYDQGDCETKASLAIDLAANAGLWAAFLGAYPCKTNGFTVGHQYLAIAIDNPPSWLRGAFNFTWKGHIFYVADVAVNGGEPRFPIKPYPCSDVGTIVAPYWQKTYFIGRPLW